MPRYVTIDLFGKVQVGKTTIFEHFAGTRYLNEGGNLSLDFRAYYARCWVLPNRWSHSMVFLTDPKFDMRWKDLNIKFLRKMFEPTNVLMIVTDSTKEDVDAITHCLDILPRIKRNLIIFIIANMQDLPNRLSVEEIQQILGIKDILGLVATAPDTKQKVEPFLESAVKRYFYMLSKQGQEMELLSPEEFATQTKNSTKIPSNTKYTHRLKLKSKVENESKEKKSPEDVGEQLESDKSTQQEPSTKSSDQTNTEPPMVKDLSKEKPSS